MVKEKSPKTREDLLQNLMEQMFHVGKQIHNGVLHEKTSFSPPQARLLFTIASCKDEGVSVKELAEKSGVTPGAITQFVDVLVKKELVRRDEDHNDRRVVRLTLTDSAKNRFKELRNLFLSSATRAFEVLSDEEVAQLTGLLAKVSASSKPGK